MVTPVAIVGAGPYALSLAAHLGARGIAHRIFGEPMRFWAGVAAAGDRRFLKSFCFGTSLSTPDPGMSFGDYNGPRGLETFEPCSMANFTNYGRWFQERCVPWVESRQVVGLRREAGQFELRFDDGGECRAARVVVATGLAGCEYVPAELAALGTKHLTHTAHIERFSDFRGRRVAVVGAGQSALEAAALLHEAGAHPRLIVRDGELLWNVRSRPGGSPWRRLRSPLSALGSGPKAWLMSRYPGALHRAPDAWRADFVRRHLPATGAWWLRERVEGVVPVELGTVVRAAAPGADGVRLEVADTRTGASRAIEVDHVVAGTGYDLDVDRLGFLDPGLRARVARLASAPRLDRVFQSSLAGLHFVGPMSAMSFGPLFRFVAGADHAARVLSAHLGRAGAGA